ncbi:MAG: hypothetical protein HYT93_03710 [Parcubacteria group bacterium]|nr:hypothetical protein [Parcubacteria group bacterium]
MQTKYIIIIAILALSVAAGVDIFNFKENGGHNGSSIIESSQENAQKIAQSWIEQSAHTYVFDGMNLVLVESVNGACEGCFTFHFSFESSHGGYGNREGLFVTQVITPHIIEIEIKDRKVIRAVTDGKYNEMTGALAQ